MADPHPETAAAGGQHPPHLRHHFPSPARQYAAGRLGMWIFLATEVLLFGGLFCAYAVYRANHPEIFAAGHVYLNKYLGGLNTVVLILSSFTMASAVYCAQRSRRRGLCLFLALTLLGGAGFMGVKYVEYQQKWKHGLLWGRRYAPRLDHPPTADARAGAPGAAPRRQGPALGQVKNVQIFFGIYFLMTGLHGLHVLAGMGVIAWLLVRSFQGRFSSEYLTPVDLGGLYWHLVDMIWIFLFPLLYLIR